MPLPVGAFLPLPRWRRAGRKLQQTLQTFAEGPTFRDVKQKTAAVRTSDGPWQCRKTRQSVVLLYRRERRANRDRFQLRLQESPPDSCAHLRLDQKSESTRRAPRL